EEEVCVWTNQYGATRIFGTTLGHHNETVGHPVYLDLITRGTLWAAGKLEDQYLKAPQKKMVPINLAKGKNATASSEETGKGNFAKNAFDGSGATRWCAGGGKAGEWLQVDLGEPQRITGCKIEWENRNGTYQYKLEGSVDGKAWKLLSE